MRTTLALLALVAAASRLDAQPVRALPAADARLEEPFTNLTAIRELSDGRLIAIDPRDKVVQLVDLKAGTLRKVGREGSGPKEYGLPMSLFALPNNTSAIFDPLNTRLLLIGANGEPGEFLKLPATSSSSRGPGGGQVMSVTSPRAVDGQGRFYTTGSPLVFKGDGPPTQADSVVLMRVTPATGKVDTVGYLEQPKQNIQASGSDGRMQMRIGMANPYTARDEWFVTTDGRVGILRSPEYRLDWIAPTRTQGPAIAYEKVKLTEGHKQQWRDGRRGATAIMMTNTNGRVTAQAGSPGSGGIQIPEPTDWPEYMPPFLGTGSVYPAPNGTVWVNRTRDARDNVPRYDVLDASGKVAYRVTLPPKTRVVGFGAGVVYTVQVDEDDLQYLQRHKMP